MATGPLVPSEIAQAIKAFWEPSTGHYARRKAQKAIADYCVKNGVHVWKILNKPQAVRAIGKVLNDVGLASRAVGTAEGVETMAGAAVNASGEVIADAALGEVPLEVAAGATGMSAGAVAFAVILFVALVALAAYAVWSENDLNKKGKAQDQRNRLNKGLNYAAPPWKLPVFPAGRLG